MRIFVIFCNITDKWIYVRNIDNRYHRNIQNNIINYMYTGQFMHFILFQYVYNYQILMKIYEFIYQTYVLSHINWGVFLFGIRLSVCPPSVNLSLVYLFSTATEPILTKIGKHHSRLSRFKFVKINGHTRFQEG